PGSAPPVRARALNQGVPRGLRSPAGFLWAAALALVRPIKTADVSRRHAQSEQDSVAAMWIEHRGAPSPHLAFRATHDWVEQRNDNQVVQSAVIDPSFRRITVEYSC